MTQDDRPAALVADLVRVMAKRCGLEDPDTFAREAGYMGPCVRGIRVSGTGRTTRTLLQAFVALEAGALVDLVAIDAQHGACLLEAARRLRAPAGPARAYRPEGVDPPALERVDCRDLVPISEWML